MMCLVFNSLYRLQQPVTEATTDSPRESGGQGNDIVVISGFISLCLRDQESQAEARVTCGGWRF